MLTAEAEVADVRGVAVACPRAPMSKTPSVTLRVDGDIATVTVNRPQVRNALDITAWRELLTCLDQARVQEGVRVVLLRGAGEQAFVAGADIADLRDATRSTAASRTYVELVESVMARLEALPQPVIAVVGGDAVGAGLELMAACDVRVARAGARVGVPAARLGIALTGQDLHRLERLIGIGRVKWLLLTGRLISAEEACQWGLVDAVHPEETLEHEVGTLASEIARNSALTHRLTKHALRTYVDPVAQGDEAGFDCSLTAWSSRSLTEGITAFLERRPPDFPNVEGQE
jgi:enoyl-CoA hydratase